MEGGLRFAYLFPNADIEVALIGRNILNDTSPTGGIDFNNLTGYVNEPQFLEHGIGAAFLNNTEFQTVGWVSGYRKRVGNRSSLLQKNYGEL